MTQSTGDSASNGPKIDDLSSPAGRERTSIPRRRKDTTRILAGWLTVVAGVLALINGTTALLHETSFLSINIDIALNEFSVCGAIIIVFGAISVIGGISAIRRGGHFFIQLAGAALGVIGDGWAGFALGLAAVFLLFLSSEDV